MSINITPSMQRNTKQFCWVYHLQRSQLKRTLFVSAVLLTVFGSSNVFPMQIWDSFLNKNHLSCKQSQTLPFFGALWLIYLFQQLFEFFWRESITFKLGKKYISMAAIVNRFYILICCIIIVHTFVGEYLQF